MRFLITYDFVGHKPEMNYRGTKIIFASNIHAAKVKFYNERDKDHFFIRDVIIMED
jgi:hypothetical protein